MTSPPPLLFSLSAFTDNGRTSLCVAKDDPSFLTATAPPQLERNNWMKWTIFPSENPKKIPQATNTQAVSGSRASQATDNTLVAVGAEQQE